MERLYGSQGLKDADLGEFVSDSDLRVGKRRVISLSFRCVGRLNMTAHISFHCAPSGLLLDWESMVGFSNWSFGEFRSEKFARPTVFRVLAAADDYYNFEFAEAKEYFSLKLYFPGGDDYLNSYCERDSPTGKKLVEVIGNASKERVISSSLAGSYVGISGHTGTRVSRTRPIGLQRQNRTLRRRLVACFGIGQECHGLRQ